MPLSSDAPHAPASHAPAAPGVVPNTPAHPLAQQMSHHVSRPFLARRAADGAEPGRPADRALTLLLLAAERDLHVGMTVSAGGVVVSGTLVGTVAYGRALADHFVSAMGGTTMDEGLADALRALMDDADDVSHGDRRATPDPAAYERSVSFVHLSDARVVHGGTVLPNGRRGVLWRCRADEVTGWSLGELIPH